MRTADKKSQQPRLVATRMVGYSIREQMGSGSFGVIFKGVRNIDNVACVIKEVELGGLSKIQQMEAIREGEILRSIQNEFVVRYFDMFIESSKLYIVMEQCEDGDLQQLFMRKRDEGSSGLEEDAVWNYFLQILIGLHGIHKQNILHRDLKTSNIFLKSRGREVRIGDFGVARTLREDFAKTVVGTPYFLSPEICENQPYNSKTDIWSLGCIVYEMCTFSHPFDAENYNSLVKKILNDGLRQLPLTFSKELRDLVARMLTKDHTKRPDTNELLSSPCKQNQRCNEHNYFSAIMRRFAALKVSLQINTTSSLNKKESRSGSILYMNSTLADSTNPLEPQAAPSHGRSKSIPSFGELQQRRLDLVEAKSNQQRNCSPMRQTDDNQGKLQKQQISSLQVKSERYLKKPIDEQSIPLQTSSTTSILVEQPKRIINTKIQTRQQDQQSPMKTKNPAFKWTSQPLQQKYFYNQNKKLQPRQQSLFEGTLERREGSSLVGSPTLLIKKQNRESSGSLKNKSEVQNFNESFKSKQWIQCNFSEEVSSQKGSNVAKHSRKFQSVADVSIFNRGSGSSNTSLPPLDKANNDYWREQEETDQLEDDTISNMSKQKLARIMLPLKGSALKIDESISKAEDYHRASSLSNLIMANGSERFIKKSNLQNGIGDYFYARKPIKVKVQTTESLSNASPQRSYALIAQPHHLKKVLNIRKEDHVSQINGLFAVAVAVQNQKQSAVSDQKSWLQSSPVKDTSNKSKVTTQSLKNYYLEAFSKASQGKEAEFLKNAAPQDSSRIQLEMASKMGKKSFKDFQEMISTTFEWLRSMSQAEADTIIAKSIQSEVTSKTEKLVYELIRAKLRRERQGEQSKPLK